MIVAAIFRKEITQQEALPLIKLGWYIATPREIQKEMQTIKGVKEELKHLEPYTLRRLTLLGQYRKI